MMMDKHINANGVEMIDGVLREKEAMLHAQVEILKWITGHINDFLKDDNFYFTEQDLDDLGMCAECRKKLESLLYAPGMPRFKHRQYEMEE